MLAARGLETSDAWIVERTGIRARHFADDGVNASDLALHAARAALHDAGRSADDLDLIIVATSTPDMVFPSTACILQHKLGVAGCPAFDMQAVCSGFVYGLTVADAMIRAATTARRCWACAGWSSRATARPTPSPSKTRWHGLMMPPATGCLTVCTIGSAPRSWLRSRPCHPRAPPQYKRHEPQAHGQPFRTALLAHHRHRQLPAAAALDQ